MKGFYFTNYLLIASSELVPDEECMKTAGNTEIDWYSVVEEDTGTFEFIFDCQKMCESFS